MGVGSNQMVSTPRRDVAYASGRYSNDPLQFYFSLKSVWNVKMPATPKELLEAASKLPETDRLVIASRLMDTLPDDEHGLSVGDSSLLEELDRRRNNRAESIPWQQLRDEWPARRPPV